MINGCVQDSYLRLINPVAMSAKGENEDSLRLQREEVRGVFVIGVLAILITLRLDSRLAERFQLLTLLDALLLYWGMYIGFASVGVSSDLLPDRLAGFFHRVARVSFKFGLFLSGVTLVEFFVVSLTHGSLVIPSLIQLFVGVMFFTVLFTVLTLLDFFHWKTYATRRTIESVAIIWLMSFSLFLLALIASF